MFSKSNAFTTPTVCCAPGQVAPAFEARTDLRRTISGRDSLLRRDGFSYRVSRSEDGLAFEHVAVVAAPPLVQVGDVVARYP
jgi:hypothetical protein